MVAFTIGYEMAYSNVLNMMNLAGIPLHAKDRKGLKNIVFAGGVCTFNPEPLADFFDFFSLGEGEDSTVEIVSLYDRAKAEDWTKEQFLAEVAKIPGVYVPSFYQHEYNEDGTLSAIVPLNGAPEKITKRIIEDLDNDRPLHGDRPRPCQSGSVPRLYPRLPLLSGRLQLPPRAQEESRSTLSSGCGNHGRFRS